MDPAFSGLAVLSLALGIASCTAVFSIFNGLFLRSLPYRNPDRLVHLKEAVPTRNIAYRFIPVTDLQAGQQTNPSSGSRAFTRMDRISPALARPCE